MDPAEGVDGQAAAPPEEREPDEVEMLLHAASPYRLVGRMLVLGAVAGMIAFGGHAYRGWQKAKLARKAPVVRVSAGMFCMGTESGPAEERPAHDVTLSSFSIDLTEVTVAAYRLCVDEGRCSPSITWDRCNGGRVDRDDHPINCVDWLQAKAFCAWAGKRLPTEEEWEYAARGRDARRWPWGNAPPGSELLNACDKECGRARQRSQSPEAPLLFEASDGWATTAPVGSYPEGESAFGVLDLAGNVWEWTASPFCTYAGAPASVIPTSPARCDDPRRVSRGGGWSDSQSGSVESTHRAFDEPTSWADDRGFRCAR